MHIKVENKILNIMRYYMVLILYILVTVCFSLKFIFYSSFVLTIVFLKDILDDFTIFILKIKKILFQYIFN